MNVCSRDMLFEPSSIKRWWRSEGNRGLSTLVAATTMECPSLERSLSPHVLEFVLLPSLPLRDLLAVRASCTTMESVGRRAVCARLVEAQRFATLLSFGALYSDPRKLDLKMSALFFAAAAYASKGEETTEEDVAEGAMTLDSNNDQVPVPWATDVTYNGSVLTTKYYMYHLTGMACSGSFGRVFRGVQHPTLSFYHLLAVYRLAYVLGQVLWYFACCWGCV
jgi:hypothetical protein